MLQVPPSSLATAPSKGCAPLLFSDLGMKESEEEKWSNAPDTAWPWHPTVDTCWKHFCRRQKLLMGEPKLNLSPLGVYSRVSTLAVVKDLDPRYQQSQREDLLRKLDPVAGRTALSPPTCILGSGIQPCEQTWRKSQEGTGEGGVDADNTSLACVSRTFSIDNISHQGHAGCQSFQIR